MQQQAASVAVQQCEMFTIQYSRGLKPRQALAVRPLAESWGNTDVKANHAPGLIAVCGSSPAGPIRGVDPAAQDHR